MGLTTRQRQYLDSVTELHHRHLGGGVHYGAVAESLGVSHWTAYDVLTRLAGGGFLRAAPAVSGPRPRGGRSRILFWPTCQACEQANHMESAQWQMLEHEFQAVLACNNERQFASAVRRKLAALSRHLSPFIYCSHTVVLFTLCLKALARNAEPGLLSGQFSTILGSSQNLLLTITGAVVAMLVLRKQSSRLLPALTAGLPEYERQLAALGEAERESLLRFARQALREIAGEIEKPGG